MKRSQRNIFISMFICAFVMLIALFIGSLGDNTVAHTIISSLSAIIVFFVSSGVFWYCTHRHDKQENTVNTVIYDAVYAVVLKYMMLIFMLGFCFKFLALDNKIFIISFVLMVVLKKALYFMNYKRSE